MDCDVGHFPSEIDVPIIQKSDSKDSLCVIYPLTDGDCEIDNMGLENTWTEDEFVVPPSASEQASALLANTVDVIAFEDPGTLSNPLLDEFDCLFTPSVLQNSETTDEPFFDSSGSGGQPGICGLQNLGNTCFMNSGIQCLIATAPISVELTRTPFRAQHRLTSALADLMRKVWSGQCQVIEPVQFKLALASHFPQFNDYRQHDCQEFLALLLDGLHEQLNRATQSKAGDGPATPLPPPHSKDTTLSPTKLLKAVRGGDGKQSTSSSQEEEQLTEEASAEEAEIRELVQEVSERQRKESNLDKESSIRTGYLSVGLSSTLPPHQTNVSVLDKGEMTEDPMEEEESDSSTPPVLNNQQPPVNSGSGGGPRGEGLLLSPVQNSLMSGGFDDILKEAKTSLLNVLVRKEEANNEIRFDSDKFPRQPGGRSKVVDKLSSNSLSTGSGGSGADGCSGSYGKRNSYLSNNLFSGGGGGGGRGAPQDDFEEENESEEDGLDLKRVKLSGSEAVEEAAVGGGGAGLGEKNRRMELERRQKSPVLLLLEKNERMECERKSSQDEALSSSLFSTNLPTNIRIDKTSEVEADKHWQKHLAENKSIVVNTFQGQFKSTVVCSVCKYISVTYEPFMYLSVPLPNAMQKKLKVTFIGESLKHPTEFLLELNKYDTVSYLRDQILLKVGCEVKGPILVAEVFDHHVAKFLEEHQLIRNLNDFERSLYAFEVKTLLDQTTVEPIGDSKVEDYVGPTACSICLEDKDSSMKQHEDCSCVLCDTCVAALCNHYKKASFDCPVCRKETHPQVGLKPLLKTTDGSHFRMMNIPLVFRLDTVGDGNNNQNHVELFGHPMVVRVPSRCTAVDSLRTALADLFHYKEPFRLLLVDGQGTRCSRCLFGAHCRGCPLTTQTQLCSQDSLAVTFSSRVPVLPTTSSLASLSSQPSALTLYDCIQAFSQSEVLDGNNPWFCPQCKQNRSATKTLSVWRYPDYLIVYLKRFVFHNHLSTKLEEKVLFPLSGLSLASGSDYDLYACVCHIGGVSAGHYTTYAQHPYTGGWHFFNDNTVSKQSPVEDDYSNAYILFYKKQGLQPPTMDSARPAES